MDRLESFLLDVLESVSFVPSLGAVTNRDSRSASGDLITRGKQNAQDIERDLSTDRVGQSEIGELLLEDFDESSANFVDLDSKKRESDQI